MVGENAGLNGLLGKQQRKGCCFGNANEHRWITLRKG